MLVTLMHAFDRRMGLAPEERRDYRILFGDLWSWSKPFWDTRMANHPRCLPGAGSRATR